MVIGKIQKFEIWRVLIMLLFLGVVSFVSTETPKAQEVREIAINSNFDYDTVENFGVLNRDDQPTSRELVLPKQKVELKYFPYEPDQLDYFSLESLSILNTASLESQFFNQTTIDLEVSPSLFDQARPFLESFKLYTLPEVAEALLDHYRQHPKFVWITDGFENDKAFDALEILSNADKYGLNPKHYEITIPKSSNQDQPEQNKLQNQIKFEMVLSAKVLTYVLDGTRGRINPNVISIYHDLPRHKVDLSRILSNILSADTDDFVSYYLQSIHPNNRYFNDLVEELERLRDSPEIERVEIGPETLIKPGKIHVELPNVIAAIQMKASNQLLNKHADTLNSYQGSVIYTGPLIEFVRDFQAEAELEVDGIVGKNTIQALHIESNTGKIEKVKFAMERIRWLPRNLGSKRVFVNQAAFSASYFENNVEKLKTRTVVGTKENQTYFFYDQIERVEYNPTWGVPKSIVINEMAPSLIEDPNHLADGDYVITSLDGQPLDVSMVDWQSVATKQSLVRIRQRPGVTNALGKLKIMFPNSHAIYMHDTPEKNLFNRRIRAFSHGCIRLQDPRGMAAAVLNTDTNHIDKQINRGLTRSEQVTSEIPVFVTYFTAWPKEDGEIGYYTDIYDRDDYLRTAEIKTNLVRIH